MLPDPMDLSAALVAVAAAMNFAALLVQRSIVRGHIDLVRQVAALSPGTRIVSRYKRGSSLQITTAPEVAGHGH
jgi:hydroxymethylglutaryl-CoA reductase